MVFVYREMKVVCHFKKKQENTIPKFLRSPFLGGSSVSYTVVILQRVNNHFYSLRNFFYSDHHIALPTPQNVKPRPESLHAGWTCNTSSSRLSPTWYYLFLYQNVTHSPSFYLVPHSSKYLFGGISETFRVSMWSSFLLPPLLSSASTPGFPR